MILQMRITEVSRHCGFSPDQIRYFEEKGYIHPRMIRIKTRLVRDYSDDDVQILMLISKYVAEGFRNDAAYKKAVEERDQPRLI